ncbi:hypothetical protein H7U32_07675 [Bifidobacterium pullorum subsp. saeculare]|uniref:Teichoic acid transporter n=1 Tax=Bifidobacterium pullorum subsp. saeculare TaxID=78257 RepID=A0A938WYY3_9BIFI|nr:hypothetical protein [Bifidobacterium pullorum]MBM6700170.1 hypothetical protein [Bifidobacterium pullorum subsp. saeculare]
MGRDAANQAADPAPVAEPTEANEATELVDGRPRVVEVSKHPVASIPETELSLADIERNRSRPAQWVAVIVAALVAIIAPYWAGRVMAVRHTAQVVEHLDLLTPQGGAFIGWTVTMAAIAGLFLALVDAKRWIWRVLFILALAAEQFVAGVSLLKLDFWYSTYVVYGDSAAVANAANLGIIGAGLGVAVFAVIWVGLLVVIKTSSPLNVLTRSWVSFVLFFAIEAVSLLVVLFGGLLTAI